jgi:hypothetical protein
VFVFSKATPNPHFQYVSGRAGVRYDCKLKPLFDALTGYNLLKTHKPIKLKLVISNGHVIRMLRRLREVRAPSYLHT